MSLLIHKTTLFSDPHSLKSRRKLTFSSLPPQQSSPSAPPPRTPLRRPRPTRRKRRVLHRQTAIRAADRRCGEGRRFSAAFVGTRDIWKFSGQVSPRRVVGRRAWCIVMRRVAQRDLSGEMHLIQRLSVVELGHFCITVSRFSHFK